MAQAPTLGKITVEATEAVREKLRQLEAELADEKARNYEIVGVLIERASAKNVSAAALKKYRTELRTERKNLAEKQGSG
jgi:hypothetical protein